MNKIENVAKKWIKKNQKDWWDRAENLRKGYSSGMKFVKKHAPTAFYGCTNPEVVVIGLNPKHPSRKLKGLEQTKNWECSDKLSEIIAEHKKYWKRMKDLKRKGKTHLFTVKVLAGFLGIENFKEGSAEDKKTRWDFLMKHHVLFLDILPYASENTSFSKKMFIEFWKDPKKFREYSPLLEILDTLDKKIPILAFGSIWRRFPGIVKKSKACLEASFNKKKIIVCRWALTARQLNGKHHEIGGKMKKIHLSRVKE